MKMLVVFFLLLNISNTNFSNNEDSSEEISLVEDIDRIKEELSSEIYDVLDRPENLKRMSNKSERFRVHILEDVTLQTLEGLSNHDTDQMWEIIDSRSLIRYKIVDETTVDLSSISQFQLMRNHIPNLSLVDQELTRLDSLGQFEVRHIFFPWYGLSATVLSSEDNLYVIPFFGETDEFDLSYGVAVEGTVFVRAMDQVAASSGFDPSESFGGTGGLTQREIPYFFLSLVLGSLILIGVKVRFRKRIS